MTPQANLSGFPSLAQGSPQLYDKFNNMEPSAQTENPQDDTSGNSEVIKLSNRFSNVFRQFQDLVSTTQAGDEADKFAKDAITAMSNWLNLAAQKLNTQPKENSGTSTY